MIKRLKIGCLTMAALVVLGLGLLAGLNGREAALRARPLSAPRLSAADKKELAEALRLKAAWGDEVWPGLGQSGIPVILFNDEYEFLAGTDNPPAPWTKVSGDAFMDRPYHRRFSEDSQAFAEWDGPSAAVGPFEPRLEAGGDERRRVPGRRAEKGGRAVSERFGKIGRNLFN